MRAQNLVAILLIISVGAFSTACQKKPAARRLHAAQMNNHSTTPVKSASNNLKKKDLGVLPLSDHVSTTISLGKNRQCTLTPTLLQSGDLQIILTMETTSTDGRLLAMNVARVVAQPGEPFDVSIDNLDLAFTPQLAAQ